MGRPGLPKRNACSLAAISGFIGVVLDAPCGLLAASRDVVEVEGDRMEDMVEAVLIEGRAGEEDWAGRNGGRAASMGS